jgi:hypothetical protein
MNRQQADTPRPVQHLQAIARRYPGLWPLVDRIRAGRGRDLDDWPDWCFMPLAGAHAIVSRHPQPAVADIGVIGALAAWRVTQGIYRFDPTTHEALASTPLETLPVEALYRLPEWCVYLETPDHQDIHGGFVHLEWDVNRKEAELGSCWICVRRRCSRLWRCTWTVPPWTRRWWPPARRASARRCGLAVRISPPCPGNTGTPCARP